MHDSRERVSPEENELILPVVSIASSTSHVTGSSDPAVDETRKLILNKSRVTVPLVVESADLVI